MQMLDTLTCDSLLTIGSILPRVFTKRGLSQNVLVSPDFAVKIN